MKIKIFHFFALCAFWLAACNIPVDMMMGGGDSAAIVYPVDGAQFQIGDVVDVKTLVNFSAGASSAILLVNGVPYRADDFTQPIPSGYTFQPWTPTEEGEFNLQVRLSGADGGFDSQTVTVFVGAASSIPTPIESTEASPTDITQTDEPQTSATATVSVVQPTATIQLAPPSLTPTVFIPPTLTPTVIVPANSSISGSVYRDENGNGNFNPADAPLSGVTVFLGTGACPSSGFQSAQTNGEGRYTFSGLFAGTYCITVDVGSLPSIGGTWQASLPNPKETSVAESESKGGMNFMFQPIIQ
ncbi:MAG: hypothetical protein H6635_09740 [Anaerolineales bacterium]|nr:hypothetical protein [Anaerolineales bacterium]MCB9145640.1 hypothetical protein [Anaerolineales bacterium]